MKKLFFIVLTAICFIAYADPIEIVVPFTPGGAVDFTARAIQKQIVESLSKETIVLNKPGAEGKIAIKYALQRPNTSNTILLFTAGLAFNKVLFTNPGYEYSEFEYIMPLVQTPTIIAVSNNSGIKNFDEFIVASQNKKINCGTSNNASLFFGRFISKKLNLNNIEIVPFKGSSELTVQLTGGNIDCVVDALQVYLPLHKDKKIKIIALGNYFKDSSLNDTKQFSDFIPGLTFSNWIGIAIPVNMNTEDKKVIIKFLNQLYKNKSFVNAVNGATLQTAIPANNGLHFIETEYQKFESMRQLIGIEKN